MRTEAELVALANENFVASFRKVVEHSASGGYREFGGVVAYATGLPLSFFNGCAVVESAAPGDLDAAMRWVAERRVPYRVFVAAELEAELATVPLAHGFERNPVPYPGMVLHPLPEPPAPASGVAIAAAGVEGREEFLEVVEAAGLARALGRRSSLRPSWATKTWRGSSRGWTAARSARRLRSGAPAPPGSTTSARCPQLGVEAWARH